MRCSEILLKERFGDGSGFRSNAGSLIQVQRGPPARQPPHGRFGPDTAVSSRRACPIGRAMARIANVFNRLGETYHALISSTHDCRDLQGAGMTRRRPPEGDAVPFLTGSDWS